MAAEDLPPSSVPVPIVWVGVDELPVFFANQFVAQVERGEIFLTVGQLVPPAILGNTDEERRQQLESLSYVPIKPVARIAFTPDRLQELSSILEITKQNYETQRRLLGDPRHS